MGKGSAPQAPSPTATAAAQTGSNVATAIAQQQLNAINTTGPGGSTSYSQNGTYNFTDPSTGQSYSIPKLTQNTTLSPEQQKIYDTGLATSQNLADLAKDQSGRLGSLLMRPFSLDNDATEGRINELANKRLDPQLAQSREAEITRLSQQGIKVGSEAYDRAMTLVDQRENDARNQLLLTGRQQAVSEALTERNQPLNELLALAGQGQVQMPQAAALPQTGIAGTDVAGITQNSYNQQMAAYNQQQQQSNSILGGLFGLGASALKFSDKRLKTDIKDTGARVAGIPVKDWKWKGTGERDTGVIAQDVERKFPRLVEMDPSGYRKVNYGGLMQIGKAAATARAA